MEAGAKSVEKQRHVTVSGKMVVSAGILAA